MQHNFLDVFDTQSQDFSMPPPPSENALFIISAKSVKGQKLIKLIFEKDKPIEDLMNDGQKQATGLKKLTPQELANLNAFLDPDKVLAPGDPPHSPH